MTDKSNLVVLSNRGPISYKRDESGELRVKRGAGGLIVTLGPGVERKGATWVAAATTEDEVEGARLAPQSGSIRFLPVPISPSDYSAYYDVVANQTLWFCLHGLWDLPRRPRFDRHWWAAWDTFRTVNEQFAAAADEAADTGATVLVHDYQLALVPELLTKRRPDLHVAAFLHTPWCSPQELSVLPDDVAVSVLSGLAGAASCGFHSARWAASFSACCETFLGRRPETFVSPAATDIEDLRSVAGSDACQSEFERLAAEVGDRQLIVRVDRIELSKNVLRGFWAYDELLETHPEMRGRVVFAAMVYPSRLGLAEYQAYGQEVNALVAQINARWAEPGWTPILLDPNDNYPQSVAALRLFDVLLVNPVRDGLNLVAKEGPLVNERSGSVVLSRQAGVWDELGDHAIGVNPFDITGTASGLALALQLSPDERAKRSEGLRAAAQTRSPLDWFDDQLTRAVSP